METSSTLSMRQEQQEKSLFLFVVVVGYIVTFTVASNGGTRYSIAELLIGIIFGVVYLIRGFFETEVLQRCSANMRNAIYFPNSGRDGIRHWLDFGTRWQLVNRPSTGRDCRGAIICSFTLVGVCRIARGDRSAYSAFLNVGYCIDERVHHFCRNNAVVTMIQRSKKLVIGKARF
jgi:hypothetical protein